MAVDPTYEELLVQIKELKEKIAECKMVEDALKESERFSTSLLENSPDAVIVYNPDSSVRYVNPAFEKITGYNPEEALGTKIPYPWWVEDPEYGTVEQRGKLGLGGLYRTERRYRKKNGDIFFVELYVTPVYEKGELSYSFSTWTDINERKKSVKDLKESREYLRTLMENTSDYIMIYDKDGYPIIFNSAYANIMKDVFGIDMRPGLKSHKLLPDKKEVAFWDDLHERVLKGEKIQTEYSYTFNNNKRYFEFSFNPIIQDDKVKGFTEISRDITVRKEMELDLKKAHHELEERVIERTRELKEANDSLYEKTINLEDVNTALKVLLEKRDRDKEENGEKVLLNVKELLLPYVDKLKKGTLTESQNSYLELLESGLHDIISPFAQKLTSRYMHITPRELQVANFVKEGKTSKEIAEIFKCTERTVVAHRANLRKKFGLKKKSNLRTYLLSLQ